MKHKIKLKEILSVVLSVSICVGIFLYVRSGSLTPPGAPASTMFSLSDIAGAGFASTTHSLVQIKAAVGAQADDKIAYRLIAASASCPAVTDVTCQFMIRYTTTYGDLTPLACANITAYPGACFYSSR